MFWDSDDSPDADDQAQQQQWNKEELERQAGKFQFGGKEGGAQDDMDRNKGLGANERNRAAPGTDYTQADQTRGDQQQALGMMRSAAQGNGPSQAEIMMRQGNDQAVASQMGMAAGARGPAAMAQAQQQAMGNASAMSTTNQNNMGAMRANEMAQARGAYGNMASGMRGQDEGRVQFGANLGLQQNAQNQQGQLAYEQMAHDTAKTQLAAQMGYAGFGQDQWKAQMAADASSRDASGKNWQQGLATAGTIAASMMSDEGAKMNVGSLMGSGGSLGSSLAPGTEDDFMRPSGGDGIDGGGSSGMGSKGDMPHVKSADAKEAEKLDAERRELQGASSGRETAANHAQVDSNAMDPMGGGDPKIQARVRSAGMAEKMSGGMSAASKGLAAGGGGGGELDYGSAHRQVQLPDMPMVTMSDARAKDHAFQMGMRAAGREMGASHEHATAPSQPRDDAAFAAPRTQLDQAYASMPPKQFEYKPGVPGTRPGVPQAGIIAQDAEQHPLTAAMVRETPHGKALDIGAATSLNLATGSEHSRRLQRLEQQADEMGREKDAQLGMGGKRRMSRHEEERLAAAGQDMGRQFDAQMGGGR